MPPKQEQPEIEMSLRMKAALRLDAKYDPAPDSFKPIATSTPDAIVLDQRFKPVSFQALQDIGHSAVREFTQSGN